MINHSLLGSRGRHCYAIMLVPEPTVQGYENGRGCDRMSQIKANGHSNQTNGGRDEQRKEKYVTPGVAFTWRPIFLTHQQPVVSTIRLPGHVKNIANHGNAT